MTISIHIYISIYIYIDMYTSPRASKAYIDSRKNCDQEMLQCGSWDDGLFGDLPGGNPRPKKKREERNERGEREAPW